KTISGGRDPHGESSARRPRGRSELLGARRNVFHQFRRRRTPAWSGTAIALRQSWLSTARDVCVGTESLHAAAGANQLCRGGDDRAHQHSVAELLERFMNWRKIFTHVGILLLALILSS